MVEASEGKSRACPTDSIGTIVRSGIPRMGARVRGGDVSESPREVRGVSNLGPKVMQ